MKYNELNNNENFSDFDFEAKTGKFNAGEAFWLFGAITFLVLQPILCFVLGGIIPLMISAAGVIFGILVGVAYYNFPRQRVSFVSSVIEPETVWQKFQTEKNWVNSFTRIPVR